jgi:hypothetical protein
MSTHGEPNEVPIAGDCYESSFKNALGLQQTKEAVETGRGSDSDKACYENLGLGNEIEIVHGWVTPGAGPVAGRRLHHAWIEIGDVVFESQGGTARRHKKQAYYGLFSVFPNQRYTVDEALALVTRHAGVDNFSAWRGKGADGKPILEAEDDVDV